MAKDAALKPGIGREAGYDRPEHTRAQVPFAGDIAANTAVHT